LISFNRVSSIMAPPAMEASVQDAQKVFRTVTGVLNGAFDEARCKSVEPEVTRLLGKRTSPTFAVACEALAEGVRKGMVPPQGLGVLRLLVEAGEDHKVPPGLCAALGVRTLREAVVEEVDTSEGNPSEDEEGDDDACPAVSDWTPIAKPLFKLVSGTFNGASSEQRAALQSQVNELLGRSKPLEFVSLCEMLGTAIQEGAVPKQGLAALRDLAGKMSSFGVLPDSKLVSALGIDLVALEKTKAMHKIADFILAVLQGTSIASLVAPLECFKVCTGLPAPRDSESLAEWTDIIADAVEQCSLDKLHFDLFLRLFSHFSDFDLDGSRLEQSLLCWLCPLCKLEPPAARCPSCRGDGKMKCGSCSGSGKFAPPCRSCDGSGKGRTRMYCPGCNGSGKKIVGDCRDCNGSGAMACCSCCQQPAQGKPRPYCEDCAKMQAQAATRAAEQRSAGGGRGGFTRNTGPPAAGVSIDRCNRAELSRLQNLWLERQSQQMPGGGRACTGEVVAAWKVDNPLLAYQFKASRDTFKKAHGRDMDKLEGFHGTHPDNVISICSTGFDAGRRAGQVYGAGEYFAKNPHVSVGYCKGGEYMLVCRLSLGTPSSTPQNTDGDHIWVPQNGYYVIKHPNQVFVQYIVKYKSDQNYYGRHVISDSLECNLSSPYSTKPPPERRPLPRPRQCVMTRPWTNALWMGLMSPHIPEADLKAAVRSFLAKYAADYPIKKLQIVTTHYSKASVFLQKEIPSRIVHELNSKPFVADNETTNICVDSYYGSPEQKCPKWIAGFCRGQNLRFTNPCWCHHETRPTEGARYTLTQVPLDGAKADEIRSKFMASAPFHNGMPEIVGIKQIKNERLARCHEDYRDYLTNKHGEEPAVQELYHGTNNNILDILYTHGVRPPSDMEPSENCPVSGGKGLCTSLCNNSCKYCTRKHEWGRCHMYGLGIYLGDMSQKSNRYVSQPRAGRYKMIVCSVLGKSYEIDGFLKGDRIMHDVHDVRALTDEDMDAMIEVCRPCRAPESGLGASIVGLDGSSWGRVVGEERDCWRLSSGMIARKDTAGAKWNWSTDATSSDAMATAPEKSDLMFVKGLGSRTRVGYSVVNSEYIAFHPHQCLPLYEIEYLLR